jgi:hypothetical protein
MVINVRFINNFVKLAMPLTNHFEKYLGCKKIEGSCKKVFKPFKGIFVKLFMFHNQEWNKILRGLAL